MTARDAVDDGDIFGEFNAMPDPDEPAPVSPDLECTVCQHVSSPHGVPVTAAAPGQAAYALQSAVSALQRLADKTPMGNWDEPEPPEVALRRDYAQAALDEVAAQDARPAPELAAAGCPCGHAQTGHAFSDDVCAVPECPCDGYRRTKPASELAAVAETRRMRDYLDDFTHAVIDLAVDHPIEARFARAAVAIRKKAGLPPVEGK